MTVHILVLFFFLMIRRPPRSTLDRSSAASDVYKRQAGAMAHQRQRGGGVVGAGVAVGDQFGGGPAGLVPVSYTHLRAHETVLDLVCRLLLEKKKHTETNEGVELSTTAQADNNY